MEIIIIGLLCFIIFLLDKIDYYNIEVMKSQAKVDSLEYQLHLKDIEVIINNKTKEIE